MKAKLTRVRDGIAVVLDAPLLSELGLREDSEVEISTTGDSLVMTPVRDGEPDPRFRESVDKINRKHAGLFQRLAK